MLGSLDRLPSAINAIDYRYPEDDTGDCTDNVGSDQSRVTYLTPVATNYKEQNIETETNNNYYFYNMQERFLGKATEVA